MPGSPKVFISYCGSDADIATELCRRLRERGADPWFFEASARLGADAWGEILEAIQNSDYFFGSPFICFPPITTGQPGNQPSDISEHQSGPADLYPFDVGV
jgi:hypothetical protein